MERVKVRKTGRKRDMAKPGERRRERSRRKRRRVRERNEKVVWRKTRAHIFTILPRARWQSIFKCNN